MTPNDATLLLYSNVFMGVMGCLLVIPVLLRKSDVFTAWNFFLVGTIVFCGVSAHNCVNNAHYLEGYRTADYVKYYVGSVIFFTTIVLTYYFFGFPRRLAGRHFLEWPKLTPATAPVIVLPLVAMSLFMVIPVPVPGLRQFLFQVALSAPTIGLACAFIVWFRSPANVFLMLLVAIAAGAAMFSSISGGTSRRYLISTLSSVPICFYWAWLRYKSTPVIFGWIVASIAAVIPILTGFTMIRHSTRETATSASERMSQLVESLPKAIQAGGSLEGFTGQDSVEAALLTIHMLNNGSKALEVYPFYSVVYIATNPIPRSVWSGKPVSLGIVVPKRSGLTSQGVNFNIGVNVVAQCYYDGGLFIHVLYAIGFGGFLRFMDELLVRQPGNPFVVGTVVAMSGQILGWPRGGIETMGLQVLLAFFIMMMICWVGRTFFGGGLAYQRSDHLDPFPVLRSEKDWQRWMGSFTSVAPAQSRPRYDD